MQLSKLSEISRAFDEGLKVTNQLIYLSHKIPGESESVSDVFTDNESVNLFELAVNTDIRRASMHPNNEETSKSAARKNKVYDLIKREIDARTKKPTVGSHTGLFVDKSRNAAISGGDRDLKADVKSKQRRDRLKGQADAAEEGDYLTFLTQGLYEMRSGSMEVKLFNSIAGVA